MTTPFSPSMEEILESVRKTVAGHYQKNSGQAGSNSSSGDDKSISSNEQNYKGPFMKQPNPGAKPQESKAEQQPSMLQSQRSVEPLNLYPHERGYEPDYTQAPAPSYSMPQWQADYARQAGQQQPPQSQTYPSYSTRHQQDSAPHQPLPQNPFANRPWMERPQYAPNHNPQGVGYAPAWSNNTWNQGQASLSLQQAAPMMSPAYHPQQNIPQPPHGGAWQQRSPVAYPQQNPIQQHMDSGTVYASPMGQTSSYPSPELSFSGLEIHVQAPSAKVTIQEPQQANGPEQQQGSPLQNFFQGVEQIAPSQASIIRKNAERSEQGIEKVALDKQTDQHGLVSKFVQKAVEEAVAEWVDQNLARICERAVREEVQKLLKNSL